MVLPVSHVASWRNSGAEDVPSLGALFRVPGHDAPGLIGKEYQFKTLGQ
jgi:hypothetical protein